MLILRAAWQVIRVRLAWFICLALLLATAAAAGFALSALDSSIRANATRASGQFDLLVAAPGSSNALLFNTVFLRASAMDKISEHTTEKVVNTAGIRVAVPMMFGDSTEGGPLVGTTPRFFERNDAATLTEGRPFRAANEAVVGFRSSVGIGAKIRPIHGNASDPHEAAAHGFEFVVVGRARSTGTQWDLATMVPIESLDKIHFQRASEPQVIAISARTVPDAYRLRHEFRKAGLIAAFPAELLVELDTITEVPRMVGKIAVRLLQAIVLGVAIVALVRIAREHHLGLDPTNLEGSSVSGNFVFRQYWIASFWVLAASILAGLALTEALLPILAGMTSSWLGIELNAHLGEQEYKVAAGQLLISLLACVIPAYIGLQRDRRH